jgi:hypothetical protein
MHYAKCNLAICKLHKGILLSDVEKQVDAVFHQPVATGFDF